MQISWSAAVGLVRMVVAALSASRATPASARPGIRVDTAKSVKDQFVFGGPVLSELRPEFLTPRALRKETSPKVESGEG